METNHDLNKLEKKIATVQFQDGIFDIVLGLALIVYGIASILYEIWTEVWAVLGMFLIYVLLATPLFLVQIYVTKPRLGAVKFKAKRKRKRLGVVIFTAVLLVANIVLLILISQGLLTIGGNVYVISAMFGVIPLFIFALMAYFMDFPRLYLIGALFSVGIFLMQLFTILDLILIGRISVMVMGIIVISIGTVYLIKFLKNYPKIEGHDYEFKKVQG